MSLYSCFIVDASADYSRNWSLFTYSRGTPVSGTEKQYATLAHTNVPRGSMSGLPMSWDMHVSHWRVNTNIRFAEPLLEWAAETHVSFVYNGRGLAQSPLIDLLMSPRPLHDPRGSGPTRNLRGLSATPIDHRLWIRENLSFEVTVEAPPRATAKFQRWLLEHTSGERLLAWLHLDGDLTIGMS